MKQNLSRRDFLYDTSIAGISMLGLSAFLQSCAEKEVGYTHDLAKIYIEGIQRIIKQIKDKELSKIQQAAGLAVQAKLHGNNLYAHLSGNMLQGELRKDRPGNPNIFITEDIQRAARDDFVLTNEPSVVRGFSERLVKVVGFSTPSINNNNTPVGALKNMGTFRLEDVADIVIYCHVPYTDGIVNVEGVDVPLFPASGVIHSLMYYTLVSEIVESLAQHGVYFNIS
ncbi:MAG: twin-arginine translocation signal domain-containing protein [Candidatus Latescibacteria bacterium]|nr:twin-arginine translocation signal domain-containing protein [Candidatus Latescibacterota bacterium]